MWGRRGGGQSGVGEYLAYCMFLNAAFRWQDWFVGTYVPTLLIDEFLQFAVWPVIKLLFTVHNYVHSRNAQACYCILLCSCVQGVARPHLSSLL